MAVSKLFRISQKATETDSRFALEDFQKMDLFSLTRMLSPFMPLLPLQDSNFLVGTEVKQLSLNSNSNKVIVDA